MSTTLNDIKTLIPYCMLEALIVTAAFLFVLSRTEAWSV